MKKNLISRLQSVRVTDLPAAAVNKFIYFLTSANNSMVTYNHDPDRQRVIGLIKRVRSENRMLMEDIEALQLYLAVRNTSKIRVILPR